MQIEVFKSKIHRVTITEANLSYVGSITIDEDLLDAANMIAGEKVQIVNVNNGERLETYIIKGVCYLTRQSVHTPGAVRKAKKALRKAFENSMQRKGLSFVEFVATCNSGWKMSPTEANRWMEQNMLPLYPLGDIKG